MRKKLARFAALQTYYDQLTPKDNPVVLTAVGLFVPASLPHLHAGFTYLLENHVIDSAGPLLDAGAGDGRVVALAASIFDIRSIGIEFDTSLARQAQLHLDMLQVQSILPAGHARIGQGDFTLDRTYETLDLTFEDFSTVFNYVNNAKDIAAKIAGQSNPGTIFLLYDGQPTATPFPGLTFVKTLPLFKLRSSPRQDEHPAYLHIFRK